MTWLFGFMLVSIGAGLGFLICAMLTVVKFNDLEIEIIELENENDELRGDGF